MVSGVSVDLDLVALCTALLAGAYFIYKKIIKPRQLLVLTALENHAKIAKIYSELYPNGGSSVRDSLIRIENGLIQVSQKQHLYLLEHEYGIFETDAQGDCVSVNRTFCRIADKTEGEFLGSGWLLNVHYDDRDQVADEWNEAVQGHRDFKMEYRIRQPKGRIMHVFSAAYPMKNPYNGKVFGYMGTVKVLKVEGE